MRKSWTDERLDDLNQRSDAGFKRVEADLRAQRFETKTEFAALGSETKAEFTSLRSEMTERFDKVDARFERMDARFDAMQRLIVQVGGGMIATLMLGVLSVLASRL